MTAVMMAVMVHCGCTNEADFQFGYMDLWIRDLDQSLLGGLDLWLPLCPTPVVPCPLSDPSIATIGRVDLIVDPNRAIACLHHCVSAPFVSVVQPRIATIN